MSWNSSKKKRGSSADGPVVLDRTVRCKNCFVSTGVYGQPDIGTVMVSEVVRLQKADGPNLDVARTVRCVQCGYIQDVIVWQAGRAAGFTRESIFSLLRASKATPTFSQEELSTGVLRHVKLSKAMQEATAKQFRPSFGQDYNPDQHIEPRAMPAPIPQEMF
jgi:hypothetical protein